MSCPLRVTCLPTSPIAGQRPGTSGLRKPTATFIGACEPALAAPGGAAPFLAAGGRYLANFVQAMLDALPRASVVGATLVLGGDGRAWTREAAQIIAKIAAANGVARLWVGRGALLSTPAVSALIREREGGAAAGGIILTASHNPGGLDHDFGIK